MGMDNLHWLELTTFVVGLIGKMGPYKVDTEAAQHNIFLGEQVSEDDAVALTKKDVITIGTKEQAITPSDVMMFIAKLKKHLSREEFNNGRSYFFEGMEIDGKRATLCWGS
jgi:hypothetical protein